MRYLFLLACLFGCTHQDWRTADRSSAHLAPLPEDEPEAVVQVYAARTFSWRGTFAVHCWVATKEPKADHYTVYAVIGFRLQSDGTAVVVSEDIPDRHWFGAEPYVIQELRGDAAARAIPKIKKAVESYPYAHVYRAWPGPNSNTFVSHIIRNVSELTVELPPHAIGKDWLTDGNVVSFTESGTGVQFSLFGLLGLAVGVGEGVEVNILGLDFGVDFWRPALKLPLIGRVGFKDAPL